MKKFIRDLKFRRRRESVTDYHKRYSLVKSNIDRVVVRKTNSRILAQVIRYAEKGDIIIASADSSELKKMHWPPHSNRPTAYLTGMLLAGKLSKEEASKDHILDIGVSSPVKNSLPFIFAKGCVENGITMRGKFDASASTYDYSDEKKIKELREKNPNIYKAHFSNYIRNKIEPESIHKLFNEVKGKLKK